MEGRGGGPSFIFCITLCKDSSVTSGGEVVTMLDSGAGADDAPPSNSSSTVDSSGVASSFSLT